MADTRRAGIPAEALGSAEIQVVELAGDLAEHIALAVPSQHEAQDFGWNREWAAVQRLVEPGCGGSNVISRAWER